MENTNELFAALSKAQGKFRTVAASKQVMVKMTSGGSYSYNYATLATIMDMIRLPFAENGLSVSQLITDDRLVTVLAHSSGQSIESAVLLPKSGDIKQLGANLTYLRRYCLTAIAGIAIDEEDDEAVADGKIEQKRQQQPVAKQPIQTTPPPSVSELDQAFPREIKPQQPPVAVGGVPTNPADLMAAVNKAIGQDYYTNPAHICNALKIKWPGSRDENLPKIYADIYTAAIDYAKQKTTEQAT